MIHWKEVVMKAVQINAISKNAQPILIELTEAPELVTPIYQNGSVANINEEARKITDHMKTMGSAIAEICQAMQENVMASLSGVKPSEVSLEFGIKLAGEAGIPVIAKTSIEGSIGVTIKWNII